MNTTKLADATSAHTTLSDLARLLDEAKLLVRVERLDEKADPVPIAGADCDSRVVAPGHLFVCKGRAFRAEYLASAAAQGAVAYLCDEALAPSLADAAPGLPALVVCDVRPAMAIVSAEAWGHPDRHMSVAGITGTKGKTTTAFLLRAILDGDEPGAHAATLGTLETYDGVERSVSRNTTPEAPDLWRHLSHAADHHLTMVMEVSSQGLKYQRVEGLTYDVAAFLNIGIDHISPLEHPSFEDYLASKLMIFSRSHAAVVNAHLDSEHARRILQAAQGCAQLTTFSLDGTTTIPEAPAPDVWASDVRAEAAGTSFMLHTPNWDAPAHIGLAGAFNVENALAAVAMALQLGIDRTRILAGLAQGHVPGRMDLVANADGSVLGIVDYAHNGMSVEVAMSSVRASYPDRWVCAVFGATGGKGVERRCDMPRAAAPYVDRLVFTEDDPGPEQAEDICREMVEATPKGTPCEVVIDRQEAIRHAFALAETCGRPAVVCVLGKGTEARQMRAGVPVPMPPDGEFVRSLLA